MHLGDRIYVSEEADIYYHNVQAMSFRVIDVVDIGC